MRVDTYPEALVWEYTGAGGDGHEKKYRSIRYTRHIKASCFFHVQRSQQVSRFLPNFRGGKKKRKPTFVFYRIVAEL